MRDLNMIIPVYNEFVVIETVVTDWIVILARLNIKYRIKLYNDGSTDGTLAKLQMLQRQFPQQVEVHTKENSGHGPTVLQGYRESLDAEWLFQVDADNEISASNFPKFWEERLNTDLVIGERKGRKSAFFRRLMTDVSYMVVRVFFGRGITDTNVPYRLMRVARFEKYLMQIPTAVFTPNIILSGIAIQQDMCIKVIPIHHIVRKTGTTSLGGSIFKLLKISFRSFKEVIAYALGF